VRRDLAAPDLPVVIGRIRDVRLVSRWRPWSDVVRLAQANVATDDPHAFLVRTDDLQIDVRSPLHFDTRGTIGLGERFVRRGFGL
jgi:carbohydrate esterase-like sialic acid-specific acetylesterase